MLRASIWTVRLFGLVVVGTLIFLHPVPEPGGALAQQIAFVALCLGQAVIASSESGLVPERVDRIALPAALALTIVSACFGASASGDGSYMIFFAITAIQGAVADLSLTVSLAIAALGVLAVEIGGIAFEQGLGTYVGYPLLLAVGVMLGRSRADYRIRAEQSAALLAQHEQLRAEQRRADVLDERARLAREIHDVLAHSLGSLGIQIQVARAQLTDRGDTEAALAALEKAQRMASEGLVETRRAVHALRSDTLPLHEELARLAPCDVAGEPRPVPADATVALIRITQESLVNAAKHAPDSAVEVNLAYTDAAVRLTIANDLPVGTPRASALRTVDGGYGLTGMRERLALLRGTLEAGPVGDRWLVAADLPLSPSPS
ncbi:MAG TPA: histidine kinase [Actinospica sp.]|nr:histidine kinase [Actinospica sp.]